MAVNIEQRKKPACRQAGWDLRPGNTVKVWQKIKEGDKVRLQAFEGLVIAHKHGFEPGATFTVRKIVEGIGVERIFPIFSPNIEKIEITKRSKTRRAKLYYVREKAAKQIRKKMKEARAIKPQEELSSEDLVKEEKVTEEKSAE